MVSGGGKNIKSRPCRYGAALRVRAVDPWRELSAIFKDGRPGIIGIVGGQRAEGNDGSATLASDVSRFLPGDKSYHINFSEHALSSGGT